MPRRTIRLAAAAVLVLGLGCRDQRPLPSEAWPTPRPTTNAAADALWEEIVDGETGPGSAYRLYMPNDWNGKLVVYAHGIVAPFLPPALPGEGDAFAAIFGAQRFAVALSSYSETGLAIKDGAQRTHQLRGLFASRFGKPSRTYLVGQSMGGFIVTALAEKFAKQYDGVLSLCGVVGGFTGEFEYVFNARLLFDFLYPGVLPGSPTRVDLPSDPAAAVAAIAGIQNAAAAAIGADVRPLPGALQIALVDQTRMPLPFALGGPLDNLQFGRFVVTPLLLHAIFVNDIVEHTHGHFPFGNAGTTYTSSSPFMPAPLLAAINGGVATVEGDRDALNWLAHNGETSGDLTIPMLTLHTRFDTWVPIVTESIYRDKVARRGRSDLLVQRTTEGFDHCNFTPAEIGKGLSDLVGWVEGRQKPVP